MGSVLFCKISSGSSSSYILLKVGTIKSMPSSNLAMPPSPDSWYEIHSEYHICRVNGSAWPLEFTISCKELFSVWMESWNLPSWRYVMPNVASMIGVAGRRGSIPTSRISWRMVAESRSLEVSLKVAAIFHNDLNLSGDFSCPSRENHKAHCKNLVESAKKIEYLRPIYIRVFSVDERSVGKND